MEKFAFLFPGQGTQFLQMGKAFYENYPIAKQTFEEASEVSGLDMANLCFHGSVSSMNEFANMQLAILTAEIAIFRAYMNDYGMYPQFAVGHSIGEYAALVSAGAMTFADAITIMAKRGELVSRIIDKNTGHMAIIEQASPQMIEDCIKASNAQESVYISCFNSGSQYAISGWNDKLEAVEQMLLEKGATVSPLFHSPPIHSPLMNEICMEYLDFMNGFEFYPFRFPVISNYTGAPLSNPAQIAQTLTYHLISPVLFTSATNLFHKYGVTATIEMSPKLLLSELINEDRPAITTYCYGLIQDKQKLDELFQSDPNFAKDMPNFAGRCLSILVSTENKNQNQNEYKEVVQIYERIKEKYNEQQRNHVGTTTDPHPEMLDMLIAALRMKRLEPRELKNCVKTLLDETNSFYRFANVYNAL
ncbi:ACP S-malonyltransferase [Paenibacillus thiaminolyticus]|uniref:[acyl-carrier-protein] S-malonyltransferase n=1 Tax=Paenibacillus thiaminolyticus TaxID=49283 RepID=A0AAP9DZ96_PANTH|nr:ACP S-malonyltransferase [Paenibacillus thiaminolyticus]MCY9534495.1 ACP S-malonyltransferase [Paenibacillus thiaminolyticus]MCY9601305.1 ACP S-malonyltransferase [Paenibacillus thiaminolyticus]MCY9606465.1 ACP S-malonyltransferase [Paenibacillus thiaminolyticus]MCY9614065.1 ACP S-malonyltransferase [Paenibacillus thiaminolyticus]MCY9618602.1 ACP S-malonyltransferase [Paenibacillus thiaminolyticus]